MATIRKQKTALKFKKPATWWGSTWREAIPCGNGKVGASIYGGAGNETILINHADLWWQGKAGVLPDVSDKIKDVRKALDNNSPKEAESIISNALISKGYRPQLSYPLPLCDLKITQPLEKQPKEYQRSLNLENGEATVSFKDGNTKFERAIFVSRVNDLICIEITRSGAKAIEAEFSLNMHDKFNARTPFGVSNLPEGVTTRYENYFMYFAARSDNSTDFGATARINHYGGSLEVRNNSLYVKGAEKVSILIKTFTESQRDKEWKAAKAQLTAVKLTYEKLLKEHAAVHGKLFNAVDLDINAENRDMFIEDLLDDASQSGELTPALVEKLFSYGRYLFISAGSESGRPITPYGLWCGDFKAVDSQLDVSGSAQMLYSQAFAGGLQDYFLAFFSHMEAQFDYFKKNAIRLFSCRGIFIPAIMAPESGFLGIVEPKFINFTAIGGWICRLAYDYYLYTDDKKFLKERALPFMKEAALFYEEFLKVKTDGFYEASPSYSPYNTPANYISDSGEEMSIARNSTIDFMIVKELLQNLIEGCKVANMFKTEIAKWEDMLKRIPNYQTNPDNTLKEYIDHRFADNNTTRYAPHLYAAYPGTESTTDADLQKMLQQTAKKRALSNPLKQNALSLVNFAHVFARLDDAQNAYECLQTLARACLMNNLVTTQNDWRGMGISEDAQWAAYTLEGNLGFTSAVQEMLLQSTQTTLKVLPALPQAWSKGNIQKLNTRMGVETDLDWDFKKGILLIKLKAKHAATIDITLPMGAKRYKGTGVFSAEQSKITDLNLTANKPVQLEIRY